LLTWVGMKKKILAILFFVGLVFIALVIYLSDLVILVNWPLCTPPRIQDTYYPKAGMEAEEVTDKLVERGWAIYNYSDWSDYYNNYINFSQTKSSLPGKHHVYLRKKIKDVEVNLNYKVTTTEEGKELLLVPSEIGFYSDGIRLRVSAVEINNEVVRDVNLATGLNMGEKTISTIHIWRDCD